MDSIKSNIEKAVNRSQALKLSVNKGPRYRIMKEGLRGSLWLMVQKDDYYLKLTGEVLSELKSYVDLKFGKSEQEDQGCPIWYLPFDGTMENIVKEFDRL